MLLSCVIVEKKNFFGSWKLLVEQGGCCKKKNLQAKIPNWDKKQSIS